jgi:hypothetical protein
MYVLVSVRCAIGYGYGFDRVCWDSTQHAAHTPSVQLVRTAAEKNRQNREQTGRKEKLAEESREGKRVEEVTDKEWGGGRDKKKGVE